MKRIVLVLSALMITMSVNSQEKKGKAPQEKKSKTLPYKWMISAGANVVDIRSSSEFVEMSKDYIGLRDSNFDGIPLKINIERKFNNGIGLQLGGSMNKITKGFGYMYEPYNNGLVDKEFMALDGKLNFYLASLIGKTGMFDPFVNLGGGYSKIGENADFKLNAGYGANIWFHRVGVKLETSYNHAFNSNGTDFFQHSIGLAYRFGRPDTDKDGIADEDDSCPKVAGLVEFKGCPDTDGDGITDKDDKCPKVAGGKDKDGCPDSDGDDVINKLDKCPEEAGPKENNGCPWGDADGDGITDNLDTCPKKAGNAANKGCPEVKVAPPVVAPKVDCSKELTTINSTEIYFDFDKTFLKAGEKGKLDRIAEALKNIKCDISLVVFSGFADKRGTEVYNLSLSERRSIKVRDYLLSIGVANIQMNKQGLGETSSRTENKFNRRVEIRVDLK